MHEERKNRENKRKLEDDDDNGGNIEKEEQPIKWFSQSRAYVHWNNFRSISVAPRNDSK